MTAAEPFTSDPFVVGESPAGAADPRNTAEETLCPVVSNEWVNAEYKHLILKVSPHALKAYAGQMFHLLCPSPDGAEVWMRRPMSVYRVDKDAGQIEFLYKSEGRGTRGMAMLAPGDDFNIAGPLGVGFHARAGLEEHRRARPRRRPRDAGAAVAARGRTRRRRHRDPERAQSGVVMSKELFEGLGARPSRSSTPTTAARSRTSRRSSRT